MVTLELKKIKKMKFSSRFAPALSFFLSAHGWTERGRKKRIKRALLRFVFCTPEPSTMAAAAAAPPETPADHRASDPSVRRTVH